MWSFPRTSHRDPFYSSPQDFNPSTLAKLALPPCPCLPNRYLAHNQSQNVLSPYLCFGSTDSLILLIPPSMVQAPGSRTAPLCYNGTEFFRLAYMGEVSFKNENVTRLERCLSQRFRSRDAISMMTYPFSGFALSVIREGFPHPTSAISLEKRPRGQFALSNAVFIRR